MKKLFFILTLFLFPAESFSEDLCKNVPPTQIILKTSFGKLTYEYQDADKFSAEINKSKRPEKQGKWSGYAGIEWNMFYPKVTYDYYQPEKNKWCLYVEKIEIIFGYKNPKIVLDNKLKPGTCSYRRTVRHEQGHQQVNIAVLKDFLPVVYDTLEETAKDFKPVLWSEKSENEIQKQKNAFNTRIDETRDILFDIFREEYEIAHSRFDNQHNYEMEWKICPEYYKNHPEVIEDGMVKKTEPTNIKENIQIDTKVDVEALKARYNEALKNHLKTLFKALSN